MDRESIVVYRSMMSGKIVIFIGCHSWFIVFLPLCGDKVESTILLRKGENKYFYLAYGDIDILKTS
jgi:hypothetical protein